MTPGIGRSTRKANRTFICPSQSQEVAALGDSIDILTRTAATSSSSLAAVGRQKRCPLRFPVIFLCALFCSCAHLVRISYPPEPMIHPAFDQRFTTWDGERVQVALTPGILDPYFARINARGGPTSLFWFAPNPLLSRLADLPIKVPFHSIIGNRGIDERADSSDGIVAYRSSHLEGAESEKIVPSGHNLLSNPTTVAEIKRILEENILGMDRDRRP